MPTSTSFIGFFRSIVSEGSGLPTPSKFKNWSGFSSMAGLSRCGLRVSDSVPVLYPGLCVAKAISTVGMTPFEVVIDQTIPGMVRFVRALAKTGSKVSSSPKGTKLGSSLTFIVWVNPMSIPMFQSFCEPVSFRFISSEDIGVDGSIKILKPRASLPAIPKP